MAFEGTGTTGCFGPAHNPWNLDRITGGSSAGSAAAVSAGLCFGSVGSDDGGSVRIPGAFCGVVGFKTSYGRVSTRGVVPSAYSMDTIGPIARTVEDAAAMLQVIAGYDPQGRDHAGRTGAGLFAGAARFHRETCGSACRATISLKTCIRTLRRRWKRRFAI